MICILCAMPTRARLRVVLMRTDDFRQRFAFGNESHRNRVHAVTRVFDGKPFSFKDVPQVPSAVGTYDFRAASVDIRDTLHGVGKMLVKAGPAAAAVELIFRVIDRHVALTANECAIVLVIDVFARVWVLGSLIMNHVTFGVVQWVVLRHVAAQSSERVRSQDYPSILRSMTVSAMRFVGSTGFPVQFRCFLCKVGLNKWWI